MTVRYAQEIPEVSSDRGDASVTLAITEVPIQLFATTLTANRTVTLPTADTYNGAWFKIVRTGLGAFTLDVGGLYTIPASIAAWVDVRHNGTSWQLHSTGRVSDVGAPLAHEHDHITNLATDSRSVASLPSDYPLGFSVMPAEDTETAGTFGYEEGAGVVQTTHWLAEDATDRAKQFLLIYSVGTGSLAWRLWGEVAEEWSEWTYDYEGDWYGLVNVPSTFPADHVENLEADSRLFTDSPTAYPMGLSVMPAVTTEDVGTFGYEFDTGVITTRRWQQEGEDRCTQLHELDYGTPGISIRVWHEEFTAWSGFRQENNYASLTNVPTEFPPEAHAASHTNGTDDIQNATASQKGLATSTQITKLDGIETGATADMTSAEIRAALKYATDALAESAAVTSFDEGVSLMLTTAGANWGPNTGEAGRVLTERTGSVGTQQFLTDNGKVFYRAYASGSWGSWVETNAWNDLTGKPSTFAPSTHATSHVTGGSDVIANAVAAGNAGLMSGSDKTKLDGVETGATADQTASEILTAIKTVDGTGSGLDADTVDGIESTALNRLSVRPVQTISASGAIAVGSDGIILLTATADRTGATLDAGGFDGQLAILVNRSAFSLTFNSTESTSRVVGGGAIAPNSADVFAWDANYGGGGTGRWARDPADAVAAIASRRTLGTSATQATAGNDSRLSDTRTPTDSSVTNAKVDAAAAIAESKLNLASDAAAGTASRRTLGTSATSAAAGNDSRLSDSRTPTAHATSHVTGGSDVIANAVAAGNAGLMSGSDKTKLDGIASGATAAVASSQAQADAETNDTTYLTPLKAAARSASHRLFDTGAAAVTGEGDTRYESTTKRMLYHDGVRERAQNNVGFMPYAYPIGGSASQAVNTALALAANGGNAAVPIVLEGHMLLESISFWNSDTATARGPAEFALWEDRLDNTNTLNVISGAVGSLTTWTPSSASLRTIAVTSPPIYLPPGIYWLTLKNNHASNTLGFGSAAAGSMAQNTAQTKTLTTSAYGTTLDFVAAAWTKVTNQLGVRLNSRVFGQTTAF